MQFYTYRLFIYSAIIFCGTAMQTFAVDQINEQLVFTKKTYANVEYLVAYDENKQYLGGIEYSSSCCRIHYLWVAWPMRGKGIGSLLFIQALNNLKEDGCKCVQWESRSTAIEFYKKFGAVSNAEEYPLFSQWGIVDPNMMKFDFRRHGDPAENLKRNSIQKNNERV